ncbi:MAG: hypothetical protein WCR42_01330 [bacterium]
MIKIIKYIKDNKLAFWISIFYVGLSIISICAIYPDDLLYGDWALIGILITFPINVISFGFRFAISDIIYPVFIIQGFMFIPTFLIITSLIKTIKKK